MHYDGKCYLAPVRQAYNMEVIFNQVGVGIEARVSPPKSGTLATQPLDLLVQV